MREEVRFGQFRFDPELRKLLHGERPIELGSRALDILFVLASANGAIVSKDELVAKVWRGRIIEENAIQVQVSALRKALDEAEKGQSYVVTVPGRGYRLVGMHPHGSADTLASTPTAPISRASIAVLPFQNMSSDPEQEYFADGMVEDIITGLSRIKWLFVTARNSSFVYKGRATDIKQVGRELGVRYVLEGSVRKAGDRVRVTAQLLDAHDGGHLWAERYDRLFGDIFAVQDEVTTSVVGAIEPNLRKVEMGRVKRARPESLDAYELVLRAIHVSQDNMPEGTTAAIPLLQRALEIEPDYVLAHAYLARCFHNIFSRAGQHEEDRRASIRHARAVAALGSDDATTLGIAGFVIWIDEHDVTTAFKLFDRALAVSGSNVTTLGSSAYALAWMGEAELAIERATRAIQLSPFDTGVSHMAIAIAKCQLGRVGEAYDAARRAVEANPVFSVPYALFAMVLVRLGRMDEARQLKERVLALDPTFTIARWSAEVGQVPDVFASFAEAWLKLES